MPLTAISDPRGRIRVTSGSRLEAELGYSRAVRDGDWIFVSNTSGSDFDHGTLAPDLEQQTRQMLRNVEDALNAAGGAVEDAVRVTLYVADAGDLPAIRPLLAELLHRARPALTAICVPLARPELKVEMEVTARVTQ